MKQVLAAIQNHLTPELGISISELEKKLNVPRRTVQRKLQQLIEHGLVYEKGHARATRYYLQNTTQTPATLDNPSPKRQPASYQTEFLDQYLPNETYYLPLELRQHLKQLSVPINAETILPRLLIDLSWNSSRLEDNTYSLIETERLIDANIPAPTKSAFETQMILNHKMAVEFLVHAGGDLAFDKTTIFNLHALLADNMLGSQEACGRIRVIPVDSTANYRPLDIPELLEEYLMKILLKVTQIEDPFEQAFFSLVHIAYLQPFDEANSPVARLGANIALIKNNLCLISFVDVANHTFSDGIREIYELNEVALLREVFQKSYECSLMRYSNPRRTSQEPDTFRLQYRTELIKIIREIIQTNLSKAAVIPFIQNWAEHNIPLPDEQHFIAVVQTELHELHAGNFARFQVSLAEFENWHF